MYDGVLFSRKLSAYDTHMGYQVLGLLALLIDQYLNSARVATTSLLYM